MKLKIGEVEFDVDVNKPELRNYLLKELFCAPSSDLVYDVNEMGQPCVGGIPLNPAEAAKWKNDAQELAKNSVWHLISHTLVEMSRKQMFEQSKSDEDIVFGKAMLYSSDIQQQIVGQLSSLQVPEATKQEIDLKENNKKSKKSKK